MWKPCGPAFRPVSLPFSDVLPPEADCSKVITPLTPASPRITHTALTVLMEGEGREEVEGRKRGGRCGASGAQGRVNEGEGGDELLLLVLWQTGRETENELEKCDDVDSGDGCDGIAPSTGVDDATLERL